MSSVRSVIFGAALAACTLATATASAQDAARFRGGVGAEAGAFLITKSNSLGAAGVQGQLGVQINNFVGVYAVPSLDVYAGHVGGLALSVAAIADFTLSDSFSIGAGPDSDAFFIGGHGGAGAAALGGGRLHLAYYPVLWKAVGRPRRKAIAIGVDMRVLAGSITENGRGIVLSPMASLSYQAF